MPISRSPHWPRRCKSEPIASPANAKEERPMPTLTPRQCTVLDLVLTGRTSRVIGQVLGLSVRTVEVHRLSLRRRLQVKTLAELFQRSRQLGFVHGPPITRAEEREEWPG